MNTYRVYLDNGETLLLTGNSFDEANKNVLNELPSFITIGDSLNKYEFNGEWKEKLLDKTNLIEFEKSLVTNQRFNKMIHIIGAEYKYLFTTSNNNNKLQTVLNKLTKTFGFEVVFEDIMFYLWVKRLTIKNIPFTSILFSDFWKHFNIHGILEFKDNVKNIKKVVFGKQIEIDYNGYLTVNQLYEIFLGLKIKEMFFLGNITKSNWSIEMNLSEQEKYFYFEVSF